MVFMNVALFMYLLGYLAYQVTPTGRHIRSFEESSWKPIEDNIQTQDEKFEEFSRQSDERQSKTKRVKNYLKKCKNALSGSNGINAGGGSNTNKQSNERTNASEQNCAYWYVDNGDNVVINGANHEQNGDDDEIFSDCEMFEKIGPNYAHHRDVNVSEETLVDDNSAIEHEAFSECVNTVAEEDTHASVEDDDRLTDSLPTLVSEQAAVEEFEPELEENEPSNTVENEGKGDVASLVDRLMGPLYPNYDRTRMVLVRQARDLLVCEYLGNLSRFEAEFCVPAAALLGSIKDRLEKPLIYVS
ncbi:Puratrophin-1-like [Carabus blaptoides fortunei]